MTNAKCDEIRGNGAYRTLTFGNLDTVTRSDLLAWIDYVTKAGDTYPSLQGRMADALRAVTKTLWPLREKNVTMYSTRHEFAAIAKLALASRQDGPAMLAALMGHASDVTATNHYGRYGKNKVLPVYLSHAVARLPLAQDEEIASVRRKSEDRKQFLNAPRSSAAWSARRL